MALRLNGSSSGYVELDVPAAAGSHTLTLPDGGGSSGQYLQTNGSGGLSWAGAGKILQVRQTFKSDTFTTASTTYTDLTGLSVSITPASTSNNILIFYYINGSNTTAGNTVAFQLVRNSTSIAVGDSDGNKGQATNRFQVSDIYHTFSTSACYLDSPGLTSSITYKVQIATQGNTATINRTGGNLDTSGPRDVRPGSGIIVMEVAPNA